MLSHVEIDLPDNPCRYSIVPNVLPNRGILAEAGVNERNVAMSATETIAVNERVLAADPLVELQPANEAANTPEVPGGIGEEDVITLVLPYVTTAREGVARLAELLETYGTYESNGIIISDVNEIWYVETIGGHHWIARRVPDDCYATIPNQLGIDDFDFDDAFNAQREFMCSADLREFMDAHHLDRTMSAAASGGFGFQSTSAFGNGGMNGGGNSSSGAALGHNHFNPRTAFGTATTKDHIYNTPRAWYMQRHLNPSEDWDSPAARYTPASDDIPWCRVPENAVTLEDVDFLMSAHFEGTPYDPYGTLGTPESRHRYRPIGINRTGHMVAMQIRPYAPEASRSIMWISYGSGPFTAATPFYANVDDTPAYLRDTTPEVSTGNLYWANRLIAALATRISTKPAMRSKDLRNRPALTAIVWWNALMPNCVRLLHKRACPNRRSVQGPRRLRKTQVLQLSQNCSSPTKKWRNTCALTLRNCSTTCSTRPAISCTTVSPCPTAGTKHKAPKFGKTRPNEPRFPRSEHSA